ncbi:MAG: hypothetical protein O9264_02990 [Leptospira sp.]|nr:hypothetical protein [Leptospira sp.]
MIAFLKNPSEILLDLVGICLKLVKMLGRIVQNLLIVLLTTFILLPTEADGVFDSVFLTSLSPQISHVKHDLKDSQILESNEFLDSEVIGNLVRSRCDYLDLVYDGLSHNQITAHFHYTYFTLRKDRSHSFLLSFLLLNLPPPSLS